MKDIPFGYWVDKDSPTSVGYEGTHDIPRECGLGVKGDELVPFNKNDKVVNNNDK